ncbi:MAG: alpha/beta fold hydrolase [Candidatus Eutrophobiaceae bacterium]
MIKTLLFYTIILAAMPTWAGGGHPEFDYSQGKKTITHAGLRFVVNDVGEGDAVILLHGFPDSRHVWRYLIPALLDANHRVIVPDLRGYGESSIPEGVEHYNLDLLALDVLAILDGLGVDKAAIVGHDFGAGLAWYTAAVYPEKFTRLAALSVGVAGNPGWFTIEQREASWYFDFFNKAGIAEKELAANDFRLFRELIRNQGDPERFFADLSRPGALTAALNWYRASLENWGASPKAPIYPMIKIPVMGIWSDEDHHLKEAQMKGSKINVAGPWRYERINGAGHWMMLERIDEVNHLLLDFLAGE